MNVAHRTGYRESRRANAVLDRAVVREVMRWHHARRALVRLGVADNTTSRT